jgi:choline dehydrogenase
MTQPAFEPFNRGELAPGAAVQDDAEILDFVARQAESAYHLCGTCRMGREQNAVVDAELRVHGMDGLRVVDASVIPYITNGNLNAPVIMIAEKAADLILHNTPAAAEQLDVYRHNGSAGPAGSAVESMRV